MLVSLSKPEPAANGGVDIKRAKRKAKIRSAWISFAGRIVAQIVGAAATVVFALVVLHREPSAHGVVSAKGAPIVAVLPFHVYAATPAYDHVADAMTDLLVTDLAAGNELRVASTTSTLRYRTNTPSVPEIAKQLGVSHIVEGSIAIDHGRARVNAQLVDASSDQHVWAKSFDVSLDDTLAVQQDAAERIAGEVRHALARAKN
jgi:TolB-like protein